MVGHMFDTITKRIAFSLCIDHDTYIGPHRQLLSRSSTSLQSHEILLSARFHVGQIDSPTSMAHQNNTF
jgi:hypothetical protein